MPAVAQAPAPATTAFDGTYIGVSGTSEGLMMGGSWSGCPSYKPRPLTIVNGLVRYDQFEGSVSQQGVVLIRSPSASRFDGQIDSHGTLRGRLTSICSFQLVWQKVLPPTMSFDGDYVGVSKETSKTASAPENCPPNGVPATLMIRNSVVLGYWQGNVDPQGVLTMRNEGLRFDGQIDSQGTIRGQAANPAGCVRTFVWQKERR
jgi:hypothetical protein